MSSAPLRRTETLSAFAAEPSGHYLAGDTWLNLCARRDLFIRLIWGQPSDEDIEALLASVRAQARAAEQPRILVDCTHLDETALADASRRGRLLRAQNDSTTRSAFVCQASLAPLVADGLGASSASRGGDGSQTFNDFDIALDWLAPALTPEERAGIRGVRTAAMSTPGLVTRLRQLFLREDIRKVDVAYAARQLGRSRRSLQRALAEQGTSFRAELNRTRLDRAKRELNRGVSITWLASELGFQNVQSFIRVFKQATGVTPGAFRRDPTAVVASAVR